MADSTGTFGHGSTFTIAATAVAQLTNISIGGLEADDLDISNMDSDSNYREFISGMINAGEATLDLVYITAEVTNVLADIGTVVAMVATFGSGGSTWSCDGYIKSMSLDDPFDDKVTASIGVKFTGIPVWA